jgi:4-hydroxy-tetrahydrodipicolinate reductase
MTINIGICGATGKMGRLLAIESAKTPGIDNVYLYSRSIKGSSLSDLCISSDVVIDFSSEEILLELLQEGAKHDTKFVIGTTGINTTTYQSIIDLAKTRAVLYSANMSFGINILQKILFHFSNSLMNQNFDVEILDIHHKDKIDSPSGTSLMLGREIAKSSNLQFEQVAIKRGEGKRTLGSIGFSSIRAGAIVGEHQIIFANDDEEITISHKALTRDIFAKSALKAALKIANKTPGLYYLDNL